MPILETLRLRAPRKAGTEIGGRRRNSSAPSSTFSRWSRRQTREKIVPRGRLSEQFEGRVSISPWVCSARCRPVERTQRTKLRKKLSHHTRTQLARRNELQRRSICFVSQIVFLIAGVYSINPIDQIIIGRYNKIECMRH